MATVRIVGGKGNRKKLEHLAQRLVQDDKWYGPDGQEIDSKFEVISMLLPPAVKAFFKELNDEVKTLCGERYSRSGEFSRWGSQDGSIVFGKQNIAIKKDRVRDTILNQEIPLKTYERFQDPALFRESVFVEGLKKVSQRDYRRGLPQIASSFGISKSSISRRWIQATSKKMDELLERDLKPLDIIAVFIDGKRFSKYGVIVALGVSADGKKYVLGIYQASTEHHQNCLSLLENLTKRGLPEEGLLFIVDGGSGLNKALNLKYAVDDPEKRKAVKLRCHFHKWQNIEPSLEQKDNKEASPLFWGMRMARTFSEAKAFSDQLETVLKRSNLSALKSYDEAKDELLLLHQLNLSSQLKAVFSTTNLVESLNYLTEEDLRRVKNWQDSAHFQRWLATSCLHNEKRMHRIPGYRGLGLLREALKILCHIETTMDAEVANVA